MRDFGVRFDRFFGDLQLNGFDAPRLTNGGGNAFDGNRSGFCNCRDGLGITFCFVDDGLFFAFRACNEGLAFTRCNVDLFLPTAFRRCNQGPLAPFRCNLLLHGMKNFGGRRQIFDFITKHFHAPIEGRLINRLHDLRVDDVSLFERFVELQFADDGAQ